MPHPYVNMPPLMKDMPRMSLMLTIFKISNDNNVDVEVKIREEQVKLQRRAEEIWQKKILKEEQ